MRVRLKEISKKIYMVERINDNNNREDSLSLFFFLQQEAHLAGHCAFRIGLGADGEYTTVTICI